MEIAWMTDAQAPYREPLFCELARRGDLTVHFLFTEEPERHFRYRPHPGYASALVPCWQIPRRGPLASLDSYQAVLKPGATRPVLDADVIVIPTWAQLASAWTMLRAVRRGVPYVIFSESTLTSRRFASGPVDRLRRWLFTHAGAVVVPGPAARDASIASGVAPERIVESVNSIDLGLFGDRPREIRAGLGEGTGPDAAGHRYVYVGQLIARKNVGALIEAFARLDGSPELDVVGDGVELPALRQQAARLGVADRVRFRGFLDEDGVVEVLASTQTLVLPSLEEVYGFTPLEARVAGLHVVVSDKAGIAENLRDVDGAWIVPPDADGLFGGLEASRQAWTGWAQDVPTDSASPERSADDVLAAAKIALGGATRT
ncbi:glycosyltransferase involved in cell wall biosynthesis [Actinomycetospora succinea]|uniref:Glycosyltransferase involved in cell wall biosynthesis n=1 Tax=Actinomycetospora succinea TaxID=663603 RepID=A0A4R6URN4_9PSEU|nr:glycosyltransferase [Actinomycetospora succinea]TDQ48886.1 glycosyltransferase involved in cell wall biosynthesis [Actinomycetospora succinea]